MMSKAVMQLLTCSVCGKAREKHPELAFYAAATDVRCEEHRPTTMEGFERIEPIAEDIERTITKHRGLLDRLAKL